MKNLAIATILMLLVLVACEREEESIMVDEGSTIIVTADSIVQNLTTKGNCYVGETIHIKAAVSDIQNYLDRRGNPNFLVSLAIETDIDKMRFSIDMTPISGLLQCVEYYKIGETYVFPILITSIKVNGGGGHDVEEPVPDHLANFDVLSKIVITEELREELEEAECDEN